MSPNTDDRADVSEEVLPDAFSRVYLIGVRSILGITTAWRSLLLLDLVPGRRSPLRGRLSSSSDVFGIEDEKRLCC